MSLTSFDIAELNPGQTLEISTASGTHYWLTRVETTRQPDSRHVHGLSVVSNNSRDVVLHICNGSPAECYVKRLIKVGEHLMIGRISAAGGVQQRFDLEHRPDHPPRQLAHQRQPEHSH